MQLNRGMELFLVASILCSALGANDVALKSVKSSSGRTAFESESESEKSSLSATELQNDGHNFKTRSSDYEATSATESSSSNTNSESEFVMTDIDNDGDLDSVKSNQRTESSSSSSSSKSKISKTELEQEVQQDGGYSANDDLDLEMSYSSASETSSSSASSSYMSDSRTSIEAETDSALQKSSSSVTEEKEFESEMQEKSEQHIVDTRRGALENSIAKGPKNVPNTKKPSQQISKSVAKNEKPAKTSPKTPVTVGGKKSPKLANSPKVITKPSSGITKTPMGVNDISSEIGRVGYSKLPTDLTDTTLPDTNISSSPKGPHQEEIVYAAEDTRSLSTAQTLTENQTIKDNFKNNLTPNIQTEEQVMEQVAAQTKESVSGITTATVNEIPCTPGSSVPSVPSNSPELIQPICEIPTSTSQVPNLPTIPTTSSSLQPQVPLTVPAVPSMAESTVQATSSVSSETTLSEKQLTDTTAQYNISPGLTSPYLQQDYRSPYSPYPAYPVYPYEKSPFLAPSVQFPYGQPEQSPNYSQSPNMNCLSPPCSFFPFGFVPLPYPFYAYPPYGFNPFFPLPGGYPNNGPPSQQPDKCRCLEYPQTATLPSSQSSPTIPKSAIENSLTNNLPANAVTDASPYTSSLPTSLPTELPAPNVVTDIKPRELEAIENLTTVPTVAQPSSVTPPMTTLPQKPLSPSQELMLNNRLPSYIIEDLEARFEQAKTTILQKYSVYPEDKTEFIEMADEQTLSYDYVILGTHVGGLSALKTLTETGKRVLILDDARLPPCETYSPYHRLALIDSSYVTTYPAMAPKTDIEKKIRVSKVVGGTLSYDMGIWDHGALHKYSEWSQTCSSWSWEKISSYFRDLENVEDVGYLNGPINIGYSMPECSLAQHIVKCFEEAGIQEEKYELDSARSEAGLIYLPSMYDSKSSMNYAEKMFAEVKGKENLDMALGLQAVKIVFESERAVGVEVVTAGGKTRVIRAAEEVIVSYGVVDTVKLLQQSGFGDAALLQQYQIPVVRDLPQLGSDILLYPMYAGAFIKCSRGALLDTLDSDFSALGYAFRETTVSASLATSFYKAFLQVQGATGSDIQINIHTFSSRTIERLMYFMKGLFNFDQEMIDFVLEEVTDHDIMFLVPQLLDGEKRAQISISGADYKAQPIINTHLYESDKDLLLMQKTLSQIRKISKTSAFKEIGGEMVQIPVKKCGQANFSKEFNVCSIRELTVAGLHFTGGAAMGVDEKTSVVDQELRLRGTQNVRLLNAAVIPDGVSADSSAISTVIGRYGADMIVNKKVL